MCARCDLQDGDKLLPLLPAGTSEDVESRPAWPDEVGSQAHMSLLGPKNLNMDSCMGRECVLCTVKGTPFTL